jgi:cytochrome d ubiquinol oxidase subunit I
MVFGLPDAEEGRVRAGVGIPAGLSILVGMSPDHVVRGLRDFPRDEWPPLAATFLSFRGMEYMGFFFIALTGVGLLLLLLGRLERYRWLLWPLVLTVPLPILANELGWIAAEVGRQPWVVYGELLTRDAISVNVPAGHVLFSIVLFGAIYALLLGVWIFLLRREVLRGPEAAA